MRCFKSGVVFALCVSFGLGVGAAVGQAKTLRKLTGPAEFPPTSFKGRQFADSRGCVFVRAGYGKTITWVPRVTRNRSQICGYKPTFVKRVQTSTPKSVAKQRPAPPKFAIRRPPPAAQKPVQKPVLRRVVHVPSPAPAPTDFSMTKTAPVVVASASAPKPWRFRLFAPRRLHPVAVSIVVAKPMKTVAVTKPVDFASPSRFEPPKGYKTAWTDGRLNPNRAIGTARGRAQMERIWTNTVPRRLIKGGPSLGVISYAAPAQ